MHDTSIQTPAERESDYRRVGDGYLGEDLSYSASERDPEKGGQSQPAGEGTAGTADGVLRDGLGDVDGGKLPRGVASSPEWSAVVIGAGNRLQSLAHGNAVGNVSIEC